MIIDHHSLGNARSSLSARRWWWFIEAMMMMTMTMMTMFIMNDHHNHHPLANARSRLSASTSPSTRKISPRIATWYIFTIISIIIMVIMIIMIRLDSTWEPLARDLVMFAFFTAVASYSTRLALGYCHDNDDNGDNEDNNDHFDDDDDDGSSPGMLQIQPDLHWSIIIICYDINTDDNDDNDDSNGENSDANFLRCFVFNQFEIYQKCRIWQ